MEKGGTKFQVYLSAAKSARAQDQSRFKGAFQFPDVPMPLFQEDGQPSPVFDAGFNALRIGIPETPETVVYHLKTRRFELPPDQLDGFAAPAVTAKGRLSNGNDVQQG